MKRISLLLALFALMAQGLAQTNDASMVLANKPRELSVGLKVGKSFFANPELQGGANTNVFFGAITLNYGICHKDRYYFGIGADVEYLDMVEAKISVPLYGHVRTFIIGNRTQGFFVDAKVGYTFGGKQSFPLEEMDPTTELTYPVGTTERSLSGLYMEAGIGYRIQKIDLFVAYDYRVAHYTTDYFVENLNHVDHTEVKPVHTVMAGLRYVIF